MIRQTSLTRNLARFEEHLVRARSAYAAHNYTSAAALIQIAAECGWLRHPGFFYSPEAEELLGKISAKISTNIVRSFRVEGRRKVLHVLSSALDVGGHTRFVWNWIETDEASEHNVVITRQGTSNVPLRLMEATKSSGGSVRLIDGWGNLRRIARVLRNMAASFDVIVLHVSPDDVVPALAFSGGTDHPPLLNINHADHVFSIGSRICDLNLNIRKSGQALTVERRGIPLCRNMVLPIPLAERDELRWPRDVARERLSIGRHEVVMLSVASPHKYNPSGHIDFVRAHLPILRENADVRLLVVGPSSEDPYWNYWERATRGRVQAVGLQTDTGLFRSAADIYCNSFPLGSLTSLLEAGLAGLPCVSWSPYEKNSPAEFLSCDDLALDSHGIDCGDIDEYITRLRFLVDLSDRTDVGAELSRCIAAFHIGEGWLEALNMAYFTGGKLAAERPHGQMPIDRGIRSYDSALAALQDSHGSFEESIYSSFPMMVRIRLLANRRTSLFETAKATLPLGIVRKLKSVVKKL